MQADLLFTQGGKSSFPSWWKGERGRRKRAIGKEIRRIATHPCMILTCTSHFTILLASPLNCLKFHPLPKHSGQGSVECLDASRSRTSSLTSSARILVDRCLYNLRLIVPKHPTNNIGHPINIPSIPKAPDIDGRQSGSIRRYTWHQVLPIPTRSLFLYHNVRRQFYILV